MSAVKDKDGDVWMATIDGNVWRYDGTNAVRYPVREGDAVVRLYSISIDRQGGVWLGTHEHGAYRFDGKEFGRFSP
jgi:ligand-binding sensor domain-containing protein